MAIRFTIDGIEIATDTADEAAAVIKRLRVVQPQRPAQSEATTAVQPVGQTAVRPASKPQAPRLGASLAQATINFLHAIRDAGPSGADTDRVLAAVQAEHPKGIGSKVALINDYLRTKHGVANLDEIYVKARGPLGRIWTPGPKLDEALDSIREVIDAHAN